MIRGLLVGLLWLLALVSVAEAHPHVWVTVKSEAVFDAAGNLAAIRHVWVFDKAYSAYSTQGLDKNGDGRISPDELGDLAKVNVEALVEYGYFTNAKLDGKAGEFADPKTYHMEFVDGQLVLTFTLPLRQPMKIRRAMMLDVSDPTYFVAFSLSDAQDAVKLVDAPAGCTLNVMRPKTVAQPTQQKLSEAFFEDLTASADYAAKFANKAIVACP